VYVLDGIVTAIGEVGISGSQSSPTLNKFTRHKQGGPETIAGLYLYCCKQSHFISFHRVMVDGEVSCGLHIYIEVDGGVVYGDRRGAPWWWAGLWEDGMCCGSETFFACGEGRHTRRNGDDGVPKLQVRGPLYNTTGDEAVFSSEFASIVGPSTSRAFPSSAMGVCDKVRVCVAWGCHLVEVRDTIRKCWGRGASNGDRKTFAKA
jgi:hypothetical protein